MSFNSNAKWPDHPEDEAASTGETRTPQPGSDIPNGLLAPQVFPQFGPVEPPAKRKTDPDIKRTTENLPRVSTRRARPKRKNSGNGGCTLPVLGVGVIVLSLVVLALFLPPLSVWNVIDEAIHGTPEKVDRLAEAGLPFTALTASAPRVEVDGLAIEAAPDALQAPFGVHVAALLPADYLAGAVPDVGWTCETDLPERHALASRVYSLLQSGTPPRQFTLRLTALPDSASGMLALYVWNAASGAWEFLPSQPGDQPGALVAQIAYLPRCLALFRASESARTVSVALGLSDTFDPGMLAANPRVYPAGLRPTAAGTLQGVLAPGFQTGQGYAVMPLIQNFEDPAVIETATVQRILENPALRAEHARQIAAFVAGQDGYAGVVIDYREVPSDLRAEYAALITDLAQLLHRVDRTLAVVVPNPIVYFEQKGWDTGGYDWQTLGRAADEIIIEMPLDPTTYTQVWAVDTMLEWAVTQISPGKLLLGLSALSVEDQGDHVFAPVTLNGALALLGVALTPADSAAPGQMVTARLSNPSGLQVQIGRDEASRTPYLRTLDAGGSVLRTMWITDAAALHFRMDAGLKVNIGGVVVRDLMSPGVVPGLADALLAYRLGQPEESQPFELAADWTVSYSGVVLQQGRVALDKDWSVEVPPDAESLVVEAQIGGVSLGSAAVQVAAPATPTPAPTLAPTATFPPAPEVVPATPTATPQAPAQVAAAPASSGPLPTVDPAILANEAIGTDFEPGAQVILINANSVLALGRTHLTWIKAEVPYHPGQSPDEQKRTIDEMQANGFKVLLSVVGDPDELAQTGFDTYASQYAAYVGGLAALGVDGIEIWQEMNTASAWPAGQIDPALYTRLLALSFNAIKTAHVNTMVITGGLAPLNAVGDAARSGEAWNDDLYYSGMAEAGAAQFADCIGVHYLQGASAPDAASGDPRGDDPIYHLPTATDRAARAFGGTLPVCYTRLGYLTPEGVGPLPAGYDWAAMTTTAQQAQWLSDAVRLSAESGGTVRLLIIWNMDATAYDAQNVAAGYAILRPGGACPACDLLTPLLEKK